MMIRYLYLFLGILLFSPFIFAVNYDSNIYVQPFVFGVIKGEDGLVIENLNASNFVSSPSNFFQILPNNSPQVVSQLDFKIKDNTLLILKINDNSPKRVLKEPGINYFYINYNTLEYPNSNIFINFKLSK